MSSTLRSRLASQVSMLGAVSMTLVPAGLAAQVSVAEHLQVPSVMSSGQGEAKVTPDRVSVLVNVQTRATTAAAAASENARRTRSVLDALTRLGLTKDQLSTEGYSAYPEMRYDRDGGSPQVTGYVVTNSVRAESKRIDQAGPIIDTALAAGANVIGSL